MNPKATSCDLVVSGLGLKKNIDGTVQYFTVCSGQARCILNMWGMDIYQLQIQGTRVSPHNKAADENLVTYFNKQCHYTITICNDELKTDL